MRVVVDYDLCESNGLCVASAPEIFRLDEDDMLHVLQEQPSEDLRDKAETAVFRCPKRAISLVDDE